MRYGIPLKCFRDQGVDVAQMQTPFVLSGTGAGDVSLAEVRLGMDAEQVLACD